jgi:hypothetical protein
MKAYTARAQRVDGWWAISVDGVKGAHTQVRRLDQAEDAVRDLVGLILDIPTDSFEVKIAPEIEAPVRMAMKDFEKAQIEAAKAQVALSAKREAAAVVISKKLTVRDAGFLLGISHQRVAQLTGKKDGGRSQGVRPKTHSKG